LELLTNLDLWFVEGDYEDKRILLGSLFTKKLLLGNNSCRTTGMNEVLDVFTRNGKGFGGSLKKMSANYRDFSATVPGVGIGHFYLYSRFIHLA